MQAVELYRTGKVARTDHINLMGLVGQERWKLGILLALRCISSGSPMSQFTTPENTADRAEGGNRLNLHVDQLPLDSLIAAEKIIVVQVQSDQFHDLFNLSRSAVGAG